MKKWIAVLLCLALLLSGCGKDEIPKGVSYAQDEMWQIWVSDWVDIWYSYIQLHFNGNMYRQISKDSAWSKNNLDLDMLGEKLGTVYRSQKVPHWTDSTDEVSSVAFEGNVYEVKGYDPGYRVCVYAILRYSGQPPQYELYVFECLNGITVRQGSEVFTDRMRLADSMTVKYGGTKLSMGDLAIHNLLKAMNEGLFISSKDENYPKLNAEDAVVLTFYDSYGLARSISVYAEGYVKANTMVCSADPDACQQAIQYATSK